jgi:phosphoribosylformimino-5-aminoimidazole carboxamide ribotide isomerase
MIAIPAVDLRDGACVQLVGGSFADERVRLDDPVAVALDWAAMGFGWLHIVDLDAAMGTGGNQTVIESIVRRSDAQLQIGGGVRDTDRVQALLDLGAERVVVGTRAIEEPRWLEELAGHFPGSIVLAADVRGRSVTTRGWARTLALDIEELVRDVSVLPLAGVLVTAVHLEGQLQGTDLALMEDVVQAAPFPVIASGGITTTDDLRALDHRGVSAAVIGMALYTGTLDGHAVAQEFHE